MSRYRYSDEASVDGVDAVREDGRLSVVVGENRRPAAHDDAHQQRHAEQHRDDREQLLLMAMRRHVAVPTTQRRPTCCKSARHRLSAACP